MINDAQNHAFWGLLASYVPARDKARYKHCCALDARLGAVLQTAREPSLAAIRMAWWRDALVAGDLSKGRGEPLIEAWRSMGLSDGDREAIDQLIDGWSVLIGADTLHEKDLRDYANGRGAGAFKLLGQTSVSDAVISAGALWALWDLAAHVSSTDEARRCVDMARGYISEAHVPLGRSLKPLRLAWRAAMVDVATFRLPMDGFSLRHYRAILWHGLRT